MNKWFPGLTASGPKRLRLFCFPHAGGGISSFVPWRAEMPDAIEICPVRAPGRESRISEKPFHTIPDLLIALHAAITPFLDTPFAFFGHSMGALIAFELARKLQLTVGRSPIHLFVSGARAPQCPAREPTTARLKDPDFLAEMRVRFGAESIPAASPELTALILPALRADFEAIERYRFLEGTQLYCPITAFTGEKDLHVRPAELRAWNLHTTAAFRTIELPGDHFFAYSADLKTPQQVVSILAETANQNSAPATSF